MRLIDADALFDAAFEVWGDEADGGETNLFMEMINNAPTISTTPNDPLTPEEMREMGGEPYWHVGLQDDSPPPHWSILDPFFAKHIEDYGYGVRWLAYRRKPEEGTV